MKTRFPRRLDTLRPASVARPRPRSTALRLTAIVLLGAAPAALAGTTTRTSVDSTGAQAVGGGSFAPSVSGSGRFVAFGSDATNLVPGDTNGFTDIFVHDQKTGTTTRVSVDPAGAEANGGSFGASISANGRFVAFSSNASNLVPGDTNGLADVFVHDLKTGTTARVSVDADGAESLGGGSSAPSISASGRFVAFGSNATNLVPGDTNGFSDIFVHDRKTGTTTRVSVDPAGAEADGGGSFNASISANGRFVAFESDAPNLVTGDTNGLADIFVHDRKTGTTVRVSVDSAGTESVGGDSLAPSISANGRLVAFESGATNLVSADTNGQVDVFVHDLKHGETTRASVDAAGVEAVGGSSVAPSISGNGRFVAFESLATNFVPGDTNGASDIFLRDRKKETTTRVSVDSLDAETSGGGSFVASSSANGRFVAFESDTTNLVTGDTNGLDDVFLRDGK